MATNRRSAARRDFPNTGTAALRLLLPGATDAQVAAIREELRGSRGHAGQGGGGSAGPQGPPGTVSNFGAKAWNTANIVATNATDTLVTLNAELYDNGAMHDNAVNNSRLTCTKAGAHILVAQIDWPANATGARGMWLRINNTQDFAKTWSAPNTGGDNNRILASLYTLALNDFVELYGWQDSGGNLNILTKTNESPSLAAQLIGY